uniref:DNA-directed DNA polymerase n=3 Tax=Macrostomum lignano TaxID=282301 RepID=A0A1I8FZS5_9PLAT
LKFEAGVNQPHISFVATCRNVPSWGFYNSPIFVAWGGAIKLLLLQAINQKFLTVVKFQAVRILVTMRIFIADLAQFQPPPQPDTVEGDGFIARLGGAKALPKFRAKGYEYEVSFTALTDIRDTFAKVISALCADLNVNDFVASKLTADNMMLAINVPPVRRSRFTAELIFKHINKVLQSDSSVLGNNFKLFLLKAWVPRGGCGSLDAAERHIQARHAMGYNYAVIANSDKRCLIRALIVAKAFADLEAKTISKRTWRTIKADSPMQKKLTGELQIAPNFAGRDFGVRVYSAEEGNTCVYALPGREVLNLHLIGEHFNAVCKVPPFFGARYYCDRCQQPYDCNSAGHKCANTCPQCKVPGANCKSLRCDYKRCPDCGLKCYNQQCFENHRRKNRAGRSRCDSVRVCPKCGYLEEMKVGQREPEHKCGHIKCPLCKQYDEAGSHLCFVKAPKVKASTMPYVFYDTETYTDEEKQHHVHLVTAVTCCETCSGRAFPRETCRLCNGLHSAANCLTGRDLGEEFSNCVSHSDCACQMADFVAVGPASLNAFFTWLSTAFRGGAIVVAHNASGYDSFLLLGALLNGLAKKRPQVLFQGSRLMSMTVDKLVFKDSLNFIPIPLAQFPKALGLADTKLAKGTFPHEFNKPANWNYVGPYPAIEYYGGKANKDYDSICAWLASRQGELFNFNREYLDYCLSDTVLLREGCIKYRAIIGEICDGLEPFVQANTIASLAMAVFTTRFMEPNSVGVIARQADQQSFKARKWLAYLNATEFGGRLRTCDSTGGEAVILGRKVDGFDEASNTVLQFHGCFYHGCEQCMPDQDVVHPLKRQPLSHIRHETEWFTRELERHNYSVRVIWEHEYDTVLASQADFIAATAHLRAPLKMEDALYGGRVECFIPHAVASETETLKYRDVAESSGSPGMSDEDKAAYIADFYAKEGVTLDKVEPNPGLRFVAKIFLNSLWGKFCQRDDLTSTEIVSSYEDWLARLTDPNLKVKACEPIGSEFMLLEYRHRYFNQRPFRYSNARLRLYEALEGLGERAIYCDTDSVVYRHSEGQWEPPHGTSLGMWTDEVPAGSRMTDFVSGGPKLYTYIVEDAAGARSQVLKCKGIRLTPEIRERSDELRSALLHGGSLQLPQLQFRRDKASCTIHTINMDKTFQRVLTKRVYGACSRPYGYK